MNTVSQIEIYRIEFDSTGFNLRQIQNVVHDFKQRFGRVLDSTDKPFTLSVELGVEQQLRHTDHRVHRRAYFMAHLRQEIALGNRCLVSQLLRLFKFRSLGTERGAVLDGLKVVCVLVLGFNQEKDHESTNGHRSRPTFSISQNG